MREAPTNECYQAAAAPVCAICWESGRAGVIEPVAAYLFAEARVGARMERDGLVHEGKHSWASLKAIGHGRPAAQHRHALPALVRRPARAGRPPTPGGTLLRML